MTVRLLLVDRDPLTRLGLTSLFRSVPSMEVVGSVGTAHDAVLEARRLQPDVIVTDLEVPDYDGPNLCQALIQQQPEAKIFVFTDCTDSPTLVSTILAGASAYLLKRSDPSRVIEAVDRVAAGAAVLDPDVTGPLLDFIRYGSEEDDPLASLGQRERTIAILIAEGKTNRQIAAELGLSHHTVKTYLSHIFQRLHVRHRTNLAALIARGHRRPAA